jgi:hypothetical protein
VVRRPGRQAGADARVGRPSFISLHFLDYLIHEPIRAVLLHGAGVALLIPSRKRYAFHKLIIESRRKGDRDATAKKASRIDFRPDQSAKR